MIKVKTRFLQTLQNNAEAKTKKETKENLKEIETSEERIEKLDKIIESLYEDKVEGKISEERYLKMSDTLFISTAVLKNSRPKSCVRLSTKLSSTRKRRLTVITDRT